MLVMPIFFPRSPILMGLGVQKLAGKSLDLDRDIHARRQIEFLQLVYRLGRRLDDIKEPLVSANLKLIHRFFVNVWGPIARKLLDQSGERNRSRNPGARPLGRLNNVDGGLIEHPVIKCLQTNANTLRVGHTISSPSGRARLQRAAAELVRNVTAPLNNSNGLLKASGWQSHSRTFLQAELRLAPWSNCPSPRYSRSCRGDDS